MKGSGIFESHPFTITNAPSMPGSASPRGIILYAKVSGDWTRRLHSIATDLSEDTVENKGSEMEKFLQSIEGTGNIGLSHPGKKVTVMIDGPYGGLKMDLGDYETVLLVAGGSGITFVLGAIEEAIRVKAGGHGPILVQVAWVVKDMCKSCLCAESSSSRSYHRSAAAHFVVSPYRSRPPRSGSPLSPIFIKSSASASFAPPPSTNHNEDVPLPA